MELRAVGGRPGSARPWQYPAITMTALIKRLGRDEEAGTAVEYGLITAVIAIALIVALVAFRDEISGMFGRAGNKIRTSS